jgi:hypothetical protein
MMKNLVSWYYGKEGKNDEGKKNISWSITEDTGRRREYHLGAPNGTHIPRISFQWFEKNRINCPWKDVYARRGHLLW